MGQTNSGVVNAVLAIDLTKVPKRFRSLIERFQGYISEIKSEEATKSFLIRPFLKLLGYDVDSPLEFDPEFVCDVGIKKGEKVDYCVKLNGNPWILIECKDCKYELSDENISQLYRYFTSGTCSAPLGILTNGIEYWFFSDTKVKNRMDTKPFFKCNILDLTEEDAEFLTHFNRENVEDLSFINKSTFESVVDSWVAKMKTGLSEKFLQYIRSELHPNGLTDEMISDIVVDKLFGGVANTDRDEVSDTELEAEETDDLWEDDILRDEVWESVLSENKSFKKNKNGVSGIFKLGDENLGDAITGSYLCFIEINGVVYDYNRIYNILNAVIDYSIDIIGKSSSDIVVMCSSMSCPVFYEMDIVPKTSRKYRGVCFKASISAKDVIRMAQEVYPLLGVDLNTVSIGLLDRETKQKLNKNKITNYRGYLYSLQNDLELAERTKERQSVRKQGLNSFLSNIFKGV